MNNWKQEIARDFLSLGSWVFFLLVVGRILVLPYVWPYLYVLIGAGLVILITELLLKEKIDYYVSRSIVLAFFTVLFYNNNNYTFFVGFALIGLTISSWFLKRERNQIIFGVILGIVLSTIGYWFNGII